MTTASATISDLPSAPHGDRLRWRRAGCTCVYRDRPATADRAGHPRLPRQPPPVGRSGRASTDHHNVNITSSPTTCAGPVSPNARRGRSDYRFAQLVSDLGTVIDSLGVGRVHLLAHDWGSIQTWAAVTDETVMGKVASFTSISGPHLNYAGKFLRSARGPRGLLDVIRQFLASGYIWFFLHPGPAGVADPGRRGRETR